MNQPSFLLWLLLGYIVIRFLGHIVPRKNQSGWDLLARAGLWAVFLFFLSTAVCELLHPHCFDGVATWGRDTFELAGSMRAFPLGLVLSVLIGLLIVKCKSLRAFYVSISNLDPYMELAEKVKKGSSGYTLLSLKNGKVYVGQMLRATTDPNEASRSILIAVILSGFRDEGTQLVRFNKNYEKHIKEPNRRAVLIPYSEIFAITPFEFEVHKAFVEEGVTLLGK